MSSEEKKEEVQAEAADSGNTENPPKEAQQAEETQKNTEQEEQELEEKITSAMDQLVAPQEAVSEGPAEKPAQPNRTKSARPGKIAYVPMDDEELDKPLRPVERKKHKGVKVAGLTAAILAVAAATAYAGVSYYFSYRFFPGTTVNGIDCSGKTAYEAEEMIAQHVENYSISVSSRNQGPQSIAGTEINYRYLSNGEVLNLVEQQKPYEWIKGLFGTTEYTVSQNVTFDKTLLENKIKSLECAKVENQVAPENAYVAFNDTEFVIMPETEGSQLNVKQAYRILEEAISGSQPAVDFAGNPDAYHQAEVVSTDPDLQSTVMAYNNFTKANITYTFGESTVTLDGSTIKTWLEFDEKGRLVQDTGAFQQHVADYVAQLAADYDTVGTTREFYTTSGRTVWVYGSAYGWKIDQEKEVAQLTQDIQNGAQTTREPVYSMTANSRGYNDLGSTYIEVDMSNQHMYYYQDGYIIFDSEIVTGLMSDPSRQTPEGIYTLYYKKSPDVLRGGSDGQGGYEYETPVQYWMPFNGGVGFHDADWQPYFGGDRYLYGGSHGCVNMPPYNAAVLYSIIQYNVPIVCFY